MNAPELSDLATAAGAAVAGVASTALVLRRRLSRDRVAIKEDDAAVGIVSRLEHERDDARAEAFVARKERERDQRDLAELRTTVDYQARELTRLRRALRKAQPDMVPFLESMPAAPDVPDMAPELARQLSKE